MIEISPHTKGWREMNKEFKLPKGIRLRGKSFAVSASKTGVGRLTGTAKTLEDAILLRRKLLKKLEIGDTTRTSKTGSWTVEKALQVAYD
ncbi:hypothetical protein ADUPG1_002490, partial [Aduncisulcus paluster]